MRRITPRTCLWPLTGVLIITFTLSIGLTYRSNHYCYAGTCGEWLFPFQARLHVVVWYAWVSLSVTFLALRAFQPWVRPIVTKQILDFRLPVVGKSICVGGLLIVVWILSLYGILIGIWWIELHDYFDQRGQEGGIYNGNSKLAAVALTGHLCDVTMGMVLLPVSRNSALASFFKLSPASTYAFHMTQAYVLFALVAIHGSLYASWTAMWNQQQDAIRAIYPVLNPTYLYNEAWPGNQSSLGVWRASLIFTGIVASLIMMAMFFTSLEIVRRRHFNIFYFTHLLGIVAVVIICLHASTMFYCTIPGLSMWLLDWGMRIYELGGKHDGKLSSIGNGWYSYVTLPKKVCLQPFLIIKSLTLPLPHRRLSGCACHSPLAHFYIHHSTSSIREIHPFTTITHLASKKATAAKDMPTIDIEFLFRKRGSDGPSAIPIEQRRQANMQWTNKLASIIDEEQGKLNEDESQVVVNADPSRPSVQTALRLEGPYFTFANPSAYRTAICLVAGTGLSGALAIASAFVAQNNVPTANTKGKSSGLGGPDNTIGPSCSTDGTLRPAPRWDRCVVVWSVRESQYADMPFFHSKSAKEVNSLVATST